MAPTSGRRYRIGGHPAWRRAFPSGTAVFHSQQAAEKAWKAFLFWHDVPFQRAHDLRELGTAIVQLGCSLHSPAERAENLTPFAWVFRYPRGPLAPTDKEAEELVWLDREVYAAILSRLPDVVWP